MKGIKVSAYRVPWWGCPGSAMSRPDYRVLDMENGLFRIRYVLVPGRRLGNYIIPYWPVTSFLSISDPPAEIAHQAQIDYSDESGHMEDVLVAGDKSIGHRLTEDDPSWSAFHVARQGPGVFLRVANAGSQSPIRMEHYFGVTEDSPVVSVLARARNLTDRELAGVRTTIRYAQDFNWSRFSEWGDGGYRPARPTASGSAFHAFSSGMGKGFGFAPIDNCELRYLLGEGNSWEVQMANPAVDLGVSESTSLRYSIQLTGSAPSPRGTASDPPERFDPNDLDFKEIAPATVRGAPKARGHSISLRSIMKGYGRPWVRGLNLRATFPRMLDDIQTLSDWGCNLLITGMGGAEQLSQIASRAHSLEMEFFLQGKRNFTEGPPSFNGILCGELGESEKPDSFGQDEDHHYWYPVGSTRDFERYFRKPASQATLEEKATHFSRYFADKWRRVLEEAKTINPRAGVWFYTPTPGIANIDPLDCYDIFIREASAIGEKLTVFPFYYGVDFVQAEYMIRRWKEGNAGRVVFLPMRDFMVRPSQFFRAVTAARRGGADGVCGFSFKVGESSPEEVWQWKSVMLAGWANFPTPDLDALCLIEEPACLVESLATSDIALVGSIPDGIAAKLDSLLPGDVTTCRRHPSMRKGQLAVHVGESATTRGGGIPDGQLAGKGVMTMKGKDVFISGENHDEVHRALDLLLRFAELGFAEASGSPR
jgi:hypothetical protein